MAGSAWTNQVQNQVIIAGNSGQLLVYSPTPGAGNLISSISARAFTDPYGNAVLRGVVDYFKGVTAIAVQMDAGAVFWWTAGTLAGPWTAASEIVTNLAGTTLTVTSTLLSITGGVKTLTGVNPNTNAAETWHSMSLLNSWANVAGFAVAQYRFVAAPLNTVEIIGAINAAAATSATFFTLPGLYSPASKQPVCSMGANASVPAGLSPWIQCDASGNLSVQNTGAVPAAWQSFFHGFISLDA